MERIVEGEYEYSSKIALKNTKKAIQGQYLANNHYGNQTFTLKAFQIVVHRKETLTYQIHPQWFNRICWNLLNNGFVQQVS